MVVETSTHSITPSRGNEDVYHVWTNMTEHYPELMNQCDGRATLLWNLALYDDPKRALHVAKTAENAVDIARLAGLPDDQISVIRQAALLHDIGKTEIKLSGKDLPYSDVNVAEEYVHIVDGARILYYFEFPIEAQTAVFHHHENQDGTGPLGLPNEQTHPFAKIIRMADLIDVGFMIRNITFPNNIAVFRSELGRRLNSDLTPAFNSFMDSLNRSYKSRLKNPPPILLPPGALFVANWVGN